MVFREGERGGGGGGGGGGSKVKLVRSGYFPCCL